MLRIVRYKIYHTSLNTDLNARKKYIKFKK